jgi:MFS family permease
MEVTVMVNWRANTRVFYGWWIVAALFFVVLNTGGMGFYCFPVFVQSLIEEFGWTMTQISAGAALWAIVYGFSGPVIGLLIARFGVTKTMLSAAVISALTLIGYASVQALWMLYTIMFFAGIAVAGTTLVPAQTTITNWFNKYRGRAMSVMMLGIGTGGFLLPPLNEYLIRLLGWRQTWLVALGATLLVVIPLIAIFVRTRPSELGLLPDGEPVKEQTSSGITGLPAKRAIASRSFWLIFSVYVLQLLGLSAMNFHFVPFAIQEAKFTSQQAASFLGLTILFSIPGRLLFGWLADRWSPAVVLAIVGVLLACGPSLLETLFIHAGLHDVNLLWFYTVPYGLGIAGNAVVLPILVSRCFGVLHFSKLMGLVMSGFAIGVVVGIPGAGKIFDSTGSYEIAFLACIVAFLLSSVLVITIQPARYHAEFVSE